jgi:hypothetical protein
VKQLLDLDAIEAAAIGKLQRDNRRLARIRAGENGEPLTDEYIATAYAADDAWLARVTPEAVTEMVRRLRTAEATLGVLERAEARTRAVALTPQEQAFAEGLRKGPPVVVQEDDDEQ